MGNAGRRSLACLVLLVAPGSLLSTSMEKCTLRSCQFYY